MMGSASASSFLKAKRQVVEGAPVRYTNAVGFFPMISSLELLESRIAPAVLLSHRVVLYSDVDGDTVTVTFSKPILTAATFASGLTFVDSPARADGSIPQTLAKISLVDMAVESGGLALDISVDAVPSLLHGGNGHVNVGAIDALTRGSSHNVDLGVVRVRGDLGVIEAGDFNLDTPGLRVLVADSFGVASPGVKSEVIGPVNAIKVGGDFLGYFQQTGRKTMVIGSVEIGGALGVAHGVANAGRIEVPGSIGTLRVGGGIIGGDGTSSGVVKVRFDIGTMELGGSLAGGSGDSSAQILVGRNLGTVGGVAIHGSVVGGSGFSNAYISVSKFLGETSLDGSLVGGSGVVSATISAGAGSGDIHIGGSIMGGSGQFTAYLSVATRDYLGATISVAGSIVGGAGEGSGEVVLGNADSIIVGGDLLGGSAPFSGTIVGNVINSVLIAGNVIGTPDAGDPSKTFASATIWSTRQSIESVFIGGDFRNGNIIAAVNPPTTNGWGTPVSLGRDTDINPDVINRIGNIVIRGTASSTSGHFGIEANEIGRLVVNGVGYLHDDPRTPFDTGFFLDAAHTILVREI